MRRRAMLLVLFVLHLVVTPAFAADAVMIATGEWAPYVSEQLPDGGPFTRIVTAACREAGMEPQYVFVPWKRCEKMVRDGEAVAAFPYMITPERLSTYDFSEAFVRIRSVMFSYKQEVPWTSFDDLKGYRIGGPIGYGDNEFMRKAGLSVAEAPDEEALFRQLRGGRIDLAGISELVGWTVIRKLFPDEVNEFHAYDRMISSEPLRLLVRKDDPAGAAFVARFNEGLAKIRKNGVLEQIYRESGLGE